MRAEGLQGVSEAHNEGTHIPLAESGMMLCSMKEDSEVWGVGL